MGYNATLRVSRYMELCFIFTTHDPKVTFVKVMRLMKFWYPAVFKENEDGSFDVSFPDLHGCTAKGKDIEDALAEAKEAERTWLEIQILEDQEVPPKVSELQDVKVEKGETARIVAVNIRLMEGYDE